MITILITVLREKCYEFKLKKNRKKTKITLATNRTNSFVFINSYNIIN